jgi:hypothetical protein
MEVLARRVIGRCQPVERIVGVVDYDIDLTNPTRDLDRRLESARHGTVVDSASPEGHDIKGTDRHTLLRITVLIQDLNQNALGDRDQAITNALVSRA